MNKNELSGTLSLFKQEHPRVSRLVVKGGGSGDSWDSFWSYDFYDLDNKSLNVKNHSSLDKLLDWCVDNSDIDCNNDGGEIIIEIDFVNFKVIFNTYYNEMNSSHSSSYDIEDLIKD